MQTRQNEIAKEQRYKQKLEKVLKQAQAELEAKQLEAKVCVCLFVENRLRRKIGFKYSQVENFVCIFLWFSTNKINLLF